VPPPDSTAWSLRSLGRVAVDGADSLAVTAIDLDLTPTVLRLPKFESPLMATVKESKLLASNPGVRALDRHEWNVLTEGWKFPSPAVEPAAKTETAPPTRPITPKPTKPRIRTLPTADTLLFQDRLLYLLQPPLDGLFDGKSLEVPFEPFAYQLEGIAFLLPRTSALLADEMGLGKTAQAILALRLLFHQGLIQRGLVVCPKPLVFNWGRELKTWAPDVPFEVIAGDAHERRRLWTVSNCPLKIINYETLCRDAEYLSDPAVRFDVAVLDEAQRIKNRDSRTSEVVRSIPRSRSWALTGTPIENHHDDLAGIFAFVDADRIPAECPAKQLATLTADSILRRTKDLVQSDMPPKMTLDEVIDLTPAQREAYDRAEQDGVIHLNELGDTLSVQHVFQLVMRLKQICNFDPLTGESAKLERLLADMEEVAESGRKAIVFSQWVEPLETLAKHLRPYGPLQYHGRIPSPERIRILDRFQEDATSHVILMTYGTGSVGLNLQFTNYVFLFDRWWNPAVEDQAINRAHRVGQKHAVTVKRYISENTIERRVANVLEAKRQMFMDVLGDQEKPESLGLSQDDIFGLFGIKRSG
jgi:SNF2 family DNA or RNA helicase